MTAGDPITGAGGIQGYRFGVKSSSKSPKR